MARVGAHIVGAGVPADGVVASTAAAPCLQLRSTKLTEQHHILQA